MAKSSKLIVAKRGKVLLVRRRRDRLWMFPGGRKRARETEKECLRREIKEELPKLKLGRLRLWKEVSARNRRSGRKMSDAIFVAAKTSGRLTIGDKKEIDNYRWVLPEKLLQSLKRKAYADLAVRLVEDALAHVPASL